MSDIKVKEQNRLTLIISAYNQNMRCQLRLEDGLEFLKQCRKLYGKAFNFLL